MGFVMCCAFVIIGASLRKIVPQSLEYNLGFTFGAFALFAWQMILSNFQ